jgi:flagellar biosynthesis/type III secretory pathway protein FliH
MSGNVVRIHSAEGVSQGSRISRAVREASLDAQEIVAHARDEAAEMLAAAGREKERVLEESRQRGFQQGLDQWNQILTSALDARSKYLSNNESELVKLAAAVARRVVGECAATEPEAVLHAAREAIRAVRSERRIRLRVRTADETVVRAHAAELSALSSEMCEIVVIADDSIQIGGCIVESDLGIIDAQFSTQLASLEAALLRGIHAEGR